MAQVAREDGCQEEEIERFQLGRWKAEEEQVLVAEVEEKEVEEQEKEAEESRCRE